MLAWMTRQRSIYAIHLAFLLMVLLPFLLFEQEVSKTTQAFLQESDSYQVAGAIVVLLSLDVFLPVPSSVVSTASGLLLGWELGFASNFVGLMLGSLLGYFIGNLFRKTFFHRYYNDDEFRQLSYDLANYGFLFLLAFRGVPLLAEMSALAAGFHRYQFSRFLIAMVLSNSVLAFAGAYLGVQASESGAYFASAFLVVPVIGYSLRLFWLRRNSVHEVKTNPLTDQSGKESQET